MTFEIVKDKIKPPAQDNLTWVFPVRFSEGKGCTEHKWLVDDFDLHLWFKEAVGRCPRHERGNKDTLQDLLENWNQVEQQLQEELAREAKLEVLIAVEGTRISARQWRAAREVPNEELPPLTEAELQAAENLKTSEEEYARRLLAAERTRVELLAKAERLAWFLKDLLSSAQANATLTKVSLNTLEAVFDVEVEAGGKRFAFRVAEDVFDDLLERGSEEAERRLTRILELNLRVQAIRWNSAQPLYR